MKVIVAGLSCTFLVYESRPTGYALSLDAPAISRDSLHLK